MWQILRARSTHVAIFSLAVPVALANCQRASGNSNVSDDEIVGILRPSAAIKDESLIRNDDSVTYTALLADSPDKEFQSRYVQELADRGLTIQESTSSAYRPAGGVRGYKIRILREVRTNPYTVKYKVAYLGQGTATVSDWPFPIEITGKRVVFQLGKGILSPWHSRVVVPEVNMAPLPFPVPLPSRSVVLGVDDERGTAKGSAGQAAVKIDFITNLSPAETIAFFKESLHGAGMPWRDTADQLGITLATPPPSWSPPDLRRILISTQPYLFTDPVGIAVPAARYATGKDSDVTEARYAKALKHIPPDAFRYLLIGQFETIKSVRE